MKKTAMILIGVIIAKASFAYDNSRSLNIINNSDSDVKARVIANTCFAKTNIGDEYYFQANKIKNISFNEENTTSDHDDPCFNVDRSLTLLLNSEDMMVFSKNLTYFTHITSFKRKVRWELLDNRVGGKRDFDSNDANITINKNGTVSFN